MLIYTSVSLSLVNVSLPVGEEGLEQWQGLLMLNSIL